MKILLDTNAYSELMRGEAQVGHLVRKAEQLFISSIVAGELIYGFRHGSAYDRNIEWFESFLNHRLVTFLPVTWATAQQFGKISATLRRQATPIPTNDIWIAAHTFETGAELLSFDGHFSQVENLSWKLLRRAEKG